MAGCNHKKRKVAASYPSFIFYLLNRRFLLLSSEVSGAMDRNSRSGSSLLASTFTLKHSQVDRNRTSLPIISYVAACMTIRISILLHSSKSKCLRGCTQPLSRNFPHLSTRPFSALPRQWLAQKAWHSDSSNLVPSTCNVSWQSTSWSYWRGFRAEFVVPPRTLADHLGPNEAACCMVLLRQINAKSVACSQEIMKACSSENHYHSGCHQD